MWSLIRNQQKMYYSKVDSEIDRPKRDSNGNIVYLSYVDVEGNVIYYLDENGDKIVETTGEKITVFTEPKEFRGQISSSLRSGNDEPYGIDNSQDYATLVLGKECVDVDFKPLLLDNGTLIWRESAIEYINGYVDKNSADYIVENRMTEELNENSYYLRRLK